MQQKWKALIIDDEPNALVVMELLLKKHCPDVEVLAATDSSTEAILLIKKERPDIVFLDIEMPHLNGFQLLEQVADENFHLVFTTAYDQYAVKAFRYSAIDYLLKPIVAAELKAAVEKIGLQDTNRQERVHLLATNMDVETRNEAPEMIAIPHARGYLFQQVKEIIYCEAHNTYTTFHFDSKPSLLVSKPLGEIEKMLEGGPFFRIHRQFLVHSKKIRELIRSDGGSIIMENGQELPLSRNKKDDLMKFLGI